MINYYVHCETFQETKVNLLPYNVCKLNLKITFLSTQKWSR